MSTYQRSTRVSSLQQLPPELQTAIRHYFQQHQFGEPESEILHCCETISEKKPSGPLTGWLTAGLDKKIHTCILLTASSLVWLRAGDRSGTQVVGAELKNIRTRKYVSPFSKDRGLEVHGVIENSRGNVRGVIGLGPEPDAQKFCAEVYQAIEKINPTPDRKLPDWLGGR